MLYCFALSTTRRGGDWLDSKIIGRSVSRVKWLKTLESYMVDCFPSVNPLLCTCYNFTTRRYNFKSGVKGFTFLLLWLKTLGLAPIVVEPLVSAPRIVAAPLVFGAACCFWGLLLRR